MIRTSLGALQVASSFSGVPGLSAAALALEGIAQACDDLRVSKKRGKQITNKCTQLLIALDEQSSSLVGTQLQQRADEVTFVFERILGRVKRFSRYSRAMTLWKRDEIRDALGDCESDLTTAMEKYKINAFSQIHTNQLEAEALARAERAEMRDLIHQLLANQHGDLQQVQELQASGASVAQVIMEEGQNELRSLREQSLMIADTRYESRSPLPQDSQRYLEYQRGLLQLHQMTGIPPSVKILDGEVKKQGDLAVAGGVYSDIWHGTWLGSGKVALKALRNIKASDPKARKRFEREIHVWAKLQNPHVLAFYGIVTDQGQHIHMVSPWQENGNVLDYIKNTPSADRLHLSSGAAQGLKYLHEHGVIHGNVKCTNILVSSAEEACICDFGMSKVVEDVTEKSASATLTHSGSARWLAPELIEGVESSPTYSTDTYSFAMAMLELMTGQRPFADLRRDASVIRAIVIEKRAPPRPQDPRACRWVTDPVWALFMACWQSHASKRPPMKEVSATIRAIEAGNPTEVEGEPMDVSE